MNGGNGKERFGDDYADIYAINRLHFKAAMKYDCDRVSIATYIRNSSHLADQTRTSAVWLGSSILGWCHFLKMNPPALAREL